MVTIPNVTNLSLADAVAALEQTGLFVEIDGEGEQVKGSFPVYDTIIKKGEPVVLFT